MANELELGSASAIALGVNSGSLSPVELVEHYLDQIRKFDADIGAFCTVDEEQVRLQAQAAGRMQSDGVRLPLLGVPVAVKDLIFTRGLRTTGGSELYSEFIPETDDVVVSRLRTAGAIILGKTNTAEFGFSANQTNNSLFGVTRNPVDLNRSPGGSSGGSAAAVAAGLAPVALASDGGGSVRIPSSFCGVYGIKPSFGRIPLFPGCRDEAFPGLSGWESLEHIGPIVRSVADAALLLDVLSGPDARDRHSFVPPPARPFLQELERDAEGLAGMRVAWSCDWAGQEPIEPDVRGAFEAVILQLESLGCELVEDAPARPLSRSDFGALVALDASPASMREAARDATAQISPRWIGMIEREWTFLELAGAVSARRQMYASVASFFSHYDAFVTPTTPFTALPLGSEGPESVNHVPLEDPVRAVLGFCYPFNATGHPAASIPCGRDGSGLPVGMQIVSDMFREDVILRLSAAIELCGLV